MKNSDNKFNNILQLHEPKSQISPVIFTSPHSGRNYLKSFLNDSQLDKHSIRLSEDAFVDEIFSSAPSFGACLLKALSPRAYVDLNRAAWELDPTMFNEDLPPHIITKSPYIAAGLGTVPKIVASGKEISNRKFSFAEIEKRILMHYFPYHQTLDNLIKEKKKYFNSILIVDCHSMPSDKSNTRKTSDALPDIVLGDNNGFACGSETLGLISDLFLKNNFTIAKNKPYAGGFTTQNYGQPSKGVHVIQIEINRSLYMNETRIIKNENFSALVERINRIIAELTKLVPQVLETSKLRYLDAAE